MVPIRKSLIVDQSKGIPISHLAVSVSSGIQVGRGLDWQLTRELDCRRSCLLSFQ